MRKTNLLLWCAVLCVVASAFAEDIVYGDPIRVGEDVAASLSASIEGRGIPLPGGRETRAAYDAHGREIVWREVNRMVDPEGGTHVFYRQYLAGVDAELMGSDAGLHYDANGVLLSAGGTQFTEVMVVNEPRIGAVEAAARVQRDVQTFAPRLRATNTEAHRAARVRGSRLQVVRGRDGGFRFVWRTVATSAGGRPVHVLVDAQSERVVAATSQVRGGNCAPDDPWAYAPAISIPAHPDTWVDERWIEATAGSSRFDWYNSSPYWGAFSHEAFWNSRTANWPSIAVYQELGTHASAPAHEKDDYAPFHCVPIPATNGPGHYFSYSLVPVASDAFRTGSSTPVYDNASGWLGRQAGDAMHHTFLTMKFFSAMGWRGWDNRNTEASIILNSLESPSDTAEFVPWDPAVVDPYRQPARGVVRIGKADDFHPAPVALDWIAHEWGHGVTYSKAGGDFPMTALGQQMDEGWADVIGTMVEKNEQQRGSWIEGSTDWTMHEDAGAGGYARGALDDGSAGHPFHKARSGEAPDKYNDRIHANDHDYDGSPHASGNMLVMAMKLLTEGGKNPICLRTGNHPTMVPTTAYGALPGCDTQVTGLGTYPASKILFRAIAYYVPASVTWETVGNHVMDAAYDAYRSCTYEKAVKQAFTAIGFKPSRMTRTCSPNF